MTPRIAGRNFLVAPAATKAAARAATTVAAMAAALLSAAQVSHAEVAKPLGAAAAAAEPDAAARALVAALGLEEAVAPVRERAGWKPLKRVVVPAAAAASLESLRAVAPGVELLPAESPEQAEKLASRADAVLGFCTPGLVAKGSTVRWVQSFNAGVERCVDAPAFRDGSVLLTNMQRASGPVIAEHVIAMVMALSRGLPQYVRQQDAKVWERGPARQGLRIVKGQTMLVVGLGGIGAGVAERAHALGMKVIGVRASGRTGPEFVSEVGLTSDLPALLPRADVVVDTLPLTADTHNLFDARAFAAMKRGAYFVNVGRGGTVVTADLVDALRNGTLGGAALDVTEPEPLPPDHPLWTAPNVIITPHTSNSWGGQAGVALGVARENLRRYVAGERMLSVVEAGRGY